MTTTGSPAPALSEAGTLPKGVTFTDNGNGTATLAGMPAAGSGGTYPLAVTAANSVSPPATQTLTLTVDEATDHHQRGRHHLHRRGFGQLQRDGQRLPNTLVVEERFVAHRSELHR